MGTRWIVIITVIVSVGIATALVSRYYQREVISVRIAGEEFRMLIADDTAELVRGLSGFPSLDENTVMLFVFPNTGRHGIWMKDMRFAIDILWLDEDGHVVHIQENAVPDSYPRVFTPVRDARYVVEMNAGLVDRLGVRQGQAVQF